MQEQRLEQYTAQARHYLENAFATLQQGDVEKAGELLWGSMAEALKGVAARKGIGLRTHREIRRFARTLSAERQEPGIMDAYIRAEHLHSNFYEVFLEVEDLVSEGEVIAVTVRKLLDLAEQSSEAQAG